MGEYFKKPRDDLRAAFDLDEDSFSFRDAGEDFGEEGDFFSAPFWVLPRADVEVLEGGPIRFRDVEIFCGGSLGASVVDGDDAAIFGEPKISFDGIRALTPGFVEGGHGVFGGIGGSAAVGDDQGLAPTGRDAKAAGQEKGKEFHDANSGVGRGFIKRNPMMLMGL